MAVYTLFGQSGGDVIVNDATRYVMGMQFSLSQNATLSGIWFYSASGANALPIGCALYLITGANTGTNVSGSTNLSPSWSGAAGSGWVKCSYASGPVLAAGSNYRVCILKDASTQVYSATGHYWDTGAGQNGLTSGIITAPKNASADGGNQDAFQTGATDFSAGNYPIQSFNAGNYWIDVEVTTSAPAAGPAYAAFMSSM